MDGDAAWGGDGERWLRVETPMSEYRTPDPHDAEAVWRSPMMQPGIEAVVFDDWLNGTWHPNGDGSFRFEPLPDAEWERRVPNIPRTFPVNFASRAHTVPDPDYDSVAANAQRYRSPT